MKIYTEVDLRGNQVKNVALDRLAAPPLNPVIGQIYYNTTEQKIFEYNGTTWLSLVTDSSYIHTDNNFTTEEKDKLKNIEPNSERNKVVDVKINGKSVIDTNRIVNIDFSENITYTQLVEKRNSHTLIPGQFYRITDFVTTSVQEDTRSAGHAFDIIVVADDASTLNENARAIQHEGDTYFADCKLSAWKLKYCLDNDTNRFAWADATNGKGVIFRMIDEWENDVPYDFKNIQYKRYIMEADNAIETDFPVAGMLGAVKSLINNSANGKIATMKWYWGSYVTDVYPDAVEKTKYVPFGDVDYNANGPAVLVPLDDSNFGWYFRYTTAAGTDASLDAANKIYSNRQEVNHWYTGSDEETGAINVNAKKLSLDNNVWGVQIYGVTLGTDNYSNSFGNNCSSNSFGNSCYYNSFGNNCYSNSFGNSCYYNSFGNSCDSNSFGNNCYSNSFGNSCYYNSFGNSCDSNSFGNDFDFNSFGNNCDYNSFGNNCYYNSFGNDCNFNSFGNSCSSNSFGNGCNFNSFGNGCNFNSFGNNCYYNSFGNDCNFNSFGNSCSSNSFGNSCDSNSFGNDFDFNSFGNNCDYNSFGNNCYYNSFGNNCDSNSFGNGTEVDFQCDFIQYMDVGNGVKFVVIAYDEQAIKPSANAPLKNITIKSGVAGTEEDKILLDRLPLNLDYEWTIAKNSSGVVKQYCEADLIN